MKNLMNAVKSRISTINEIIHHPTNIDAKFMGIQKYIEWNIGIRLLKADYILPLTNGSKIILSNRQNYATLSYTCQLWDFNEMLFAAHFLRPEDVFVDIGANVGGYTIVSSRVAGARTIAVEPVIATFRELHRNIDLNKIGFLVETHQCGLGDEAGLFHITSNLGGLNHIVLDENKKNSQIIEIITLDKLLSGRTCTLIKIDAEGFEMNILRGAEKTLCDQNLKAIIIELNGSSGRYGHSDLEIHQEIIKYGFEPFSYYPDKRALLRTKSFNANGFNTLYLRDEKSVSEKIKNASKVDVGGLSI